MTITIKVVMIYLFQMVPIQLLLIASLLATSLGLYGYDCGEQLTNLTTISLLDVEECDIKLPRINSTKIYGQLLQLNDYNLVHAFRCSIKITRTATYCGMHSHSSRLSGGEVTYYKDVTREECLKVHITGYLAIGNTAFFGLLRNQTNIRAVEFAGSANTKGEYEGGSFSDAYGTYKNAYVAGTVEVKLFDYTHEVHLETNRIKLGSGVTCTFTEGTCIDDDATQVFWSVTPEAECAAHKYTILYEGNIDKIYEYEGSKTMYLLESEEITFALWKKGEQNICGLKVARTEHPKLFLLENARVNTFIRKAPSAVANLDIFAYVNSKFL